MKSGRIVLIQNGGRIFLSVGASVVSSVAAIMEYNFVFPTHSRAFIRKSPLIALHHLFHRFIVLALADVHGPYSLQKALATSSAE